MPPDQGNLKICLLSYRGNPYCGGQGIYIHHLARELAALGHRITVLAGPPYPADMDGARVEYLANHIFFGSSTSKIFRRVPVSSLLSPLNLYEYTSSRFGVFPEIRAFSFRAYLRLHAILQQDGFDILHDNQCLGYGFLLVKRFGIPMVSTIHHPLTIDRSTWFETTSSLKQKIKMICYYPLLMQRIVANRMDRIITVSRSAAAEIQNAFSIPENRIRVIYNGLDTSVFRPIPEVERIPSRIIFVGNVGDHKKGLSYLLQAMTLIEEGVHLVIVDGGTPARISTQEMIARFGLRHRITITGKITPKELVRLYAGSQLAVVPSLYEGFGFPAAEAMACGLPVVSTNAGALPEVVGTDARTGILVPPRNPPALAKAIMELIADPARCKLMGTLARERVLHAFSWKRTAQQVLEVYREVLDAHRRLQDISAKGR